MAKLLLEKVTECDPSILNPWHNLGLIYLDTHDSSKAIHCFEKVISLSPKDPFALLALIRLCAYEEKFAAALKYCENLISTGLETKQSFIYKVQLLNQLDRYTEAVECIKRATRNDPSNDLPWFMLSEIAEGAKDYPTSFIVSLEFQKIQLRNNIKTSRDLERIQERIHRLKIYLGP